MYRFLDQSQAAILRVQPTFQAWLKKQLPSLDKNAAHVSAICNPNAESTIDTEVTISADNANTITLLRHQQSSILEHLNLANPDLCINKLSFRVDLAAVKAAAQHQKQHQQTLDNDVNHIVERPTPSAEALASIQQLQNSVKNPDLAESLGNLAETLKTASKSDH